MKQQVINNKRTAGFTLIELLVVLVILGLLAGLVGPNVMKYVGSSKVEVAKAQLEDLAAGLDLFKLDVGRYPTLDPWNNEYIYAIPGQGNDFDLLSLGADGEAEGTGEDADLSAWD
jgi:general secretion pathway protein G